jgi:NAD(P)-dependent dehydrogenase (short-subunit alcohol dehydrogenase family)
MFEIPDKVAIVTGSTRGIGLAIAQAFGQAGAKIVVSSRKKENCEDGLKHLKSQGIEAISQPCNMSKRDQVEQLVNKAVSQYGRLDIVVGNAAANPFYGPLTDIEDAAFEKIFATNLQSNLWLCKAALPYIANAGGGSVIMISSIAALRGSKGIGAYGVSKAALIQLTRNLAVEWGPSGIRVNSIAPGLIKTEFARELWEDPERLEKIENRTPLRRIGTPEDIAGVALFLASDASAYVTGQVIVADGGELIS